MNKPVCFTLFLTLCAVLAAPVARTDSPPAIPDAFMKQLVGGINARDLDALRKIIHPATLKCMTQNTLDYYSWWLWKDGSRRYTIAADYQVSLENPLNVKALEGSLPKNADVNAHWPAVPDTGFTINYHPAPMSILSRLFEISLTGGDARLIMDCPTASGLQKFHEKRAADATQKKKLEHLWHSLSPEDKQPLIMLAKQGMKLDGLKIAAQKYHLDAHDGLAFMDMIQYEDNP